jgi:PAS domain-containing protein
MTLFLEFRRKMLSALIKIRHSGRLFILPMLLLLCTLFYYFGELVDWAAWDSIRWQFFYGIHDVHRLLFLAPIIYAAYIARVKGAVLITVVSLMIFLPRAFIISPFPDPLLRMALFTLIAGVIGYLVAIIRNESERRRTLESLFKREREQFLRILDGMGDGVLITGPDYKVRFINSSMRRDFGDGIGSYCYKYLHNRNVPCEQACKLPNVIDGEISGWEYSMPDGMAYEVLASPYIDSDGVVCQLAVFRNITHRKWIKPESSKSTS